MLVVIPFCAKDEWLAIKNLELCLELDGKSDFPCLLTHDRETTKERVEELARKYFREVHVLEYETWNGPKNWPTVQNWAWQSTARGIYERFKNCAWLWWEADATPIQKGWLNAIWTEYQKGQKPFMGHIVDGMGGHMNGVGVYPWDVCRYSTSAMLTRQAPWDVALNGETRASTHRANHLFAHKPRFHGIKLSVVNRDVLKELRNRGAVIFHGCNDGTMVDLVAGKKPKVSEGEFVREFKPEDIDAQFDESEPIWQMESMRLKSLGYGYAEHAECRKEMPKFSQQTPWKSGTFNLPITHTQCWFNCGLTKDALGAKWLLARRWTRGTPQDKLWMSRLIACRFDDQFNINYTHELQIPKVSHNEEHEDPRVVFHNGNYFVSFCSWVRGAQFSAKQILGVFDQNWRLLKTFQPHYGKNSPRVLTGSEKNWVWFNHEGAWHFVYSFKPHTVIRLASEMALTSYSSEPKVSEWKYGEIRGGTPPVRIGDEYLSFFHSSMPWKGRQKRYYMGAYVFEAKPPFRVKRMTMQPLLAGSEHDSRLLGSPLVIFAVGSLLENNEWLVTFGENDERCSWIKIPHEDLERRMQCI